VTNSGIKVSAALKNVARLARPSEALARLNQPGEADGNGGTNQSLVKRLRTRQAYDERAWKRFGGGVDI
jgi:hypothetical protein